MSRRRFLSVLVLLGLLFGQTAHAQEAESALDDVDITVFTTAVDDDDQSSPPPANPGPAVNYNVTLAPPDATFLAELFSADVLTELPDNSDVKMVTDFQWKRFLNRSDSIPFFLCATNGHRGYQEMMTAFNHTNALPLFANASVSCQLIHASAGTVLNVTTRLPQIVNGGPIPSVVKISSDLRKSVDTGIFFNATFPRLRLVMSPGMEQDEKALRTVLYRIVRRLRTGEFLNVVEEDFEWAAVGTAADPSTAARRQVLRRRVRQRQRERLLMMQTDDNEVDDKSLNRFTEDQPRRVNGAQTWADYVDPVLDGKFQCSFEQVAASIQYPYLRLSGFDKIVNAASENWTLQYSNSTHQGKSACLMSLLAFVSSDPAVLFIEEFKNIEMYNAAAAYISQGGSDGIYDEDKSTFPYYSVGLDGKGQVLQVVDTGLDQNSCFFSDSSGPVAITTISAAAFDTKKRKVIQYVQWADDTDVIDGHGTHVAGSAVGESVDPNFDYDTYKGAAPGAKVAFFDVGFDTGSLSVPANFATRLFPPGYKAGARIFSNSWGTPAAKSYTTSDTEIDKFMHDNDDALIFVSGGNSGQAGLGSVSSPALSKNVMSVGASLNERDASFNRDHVAYFSSLGPTLDGRIKPDVLAPGRRVVSAAAGSNCGVIRRQGTSMSTPIAAGSATLVRQYFMEGYYPRGIRTATDAFVPTGALVKAMLINSAVPMKAVRFANNSLMQLGLPPDVYQGHGRIKLNEVLRVQSLGSRTTSNLFVVNNATIKEAEKHVYKLSVPSDSSSPIKVTLVWIEPPTTASSASIVLHDLDLMVYSQLNKKAFYPNGLSKKDTVNTVEKVVIYTPTAGDTLTVTVTGTSIATRPWQKYALVASGDFVTGAWYCQFPQAGRAGEEFTTENCAKTCDNSGNFKHPVCCNAAAGDVCDLEELSKALASSFQCDAATQPVECLPSPGRESTPAPTPSLGTWYCQFPRLGRSNDASTISNCNVKCDDSGVRLNPVCCDPATAGNVCNEEEQAAAVASGLKCDPAIRPVDCSRGANTPAPTSSVLPMAHAGNVCNEEEQAAAVASGLKCDPAIRPVDCSRGANTPAPTSVPPRVPTKKPVAPIAGAWYCQYPRETRSNEAYTLANCRAKCDTSGLLKNPICCLEAEAGGVCNGIEYNSAQLAGVQCDPSTMPVCEA
ncbi:subtilisin-like serine peptidase [Nannochloropsis oceanica]